MLRVIDGDTIEVRFENAAMARVRLIGVDTPETVDPRRPVQCFGEEARARTRELLEGRRVWVERDVSQTDRFGRLLRYVWLDEQTMANDALVWDGYAHEHFRAGRAVCRGVRGEHAGRAGGKPRAVERLLGVAPTRHSRRSLAPAAPAAPH